MIVGRLGRDARLLPLLLLRSAARLDRNGAPAFGSVRNLATTPRGSRLLADSSPVDLADQIVKDVFARIGNEKLGTLGERQ